MSQNNGLAKRSEKGLLTPDNCVVTLIDHQPQMLFGTSNFDRQGIINSTAALSRAASVFGVRRTAHRIEPDFQFQPQVYRSDGETLRLQNGRFSFLASRGPEYRP